MKRKTALSCTVAALFAVAVAHGADKPTPAERAVGYRQGV